MVSKIDKYAELSEKGLAGLIHNYNFYTLSVSDIYRMRKMIRDASLPELKKAITDSQYSSEGYRMKISKSFIKEILKYHKTKTKRSNEFLD